MTPAFMAAAALLKSWWKLFVGVALAILPAFLLGRCSVDVRALCAAKVTEQSVATLRVDRAADQEAAVVRSADDQRIATASQTIKEQTDALPDQAPTARQHARACGLLRERAAAADVLLRARC